MILYEILCYYHIALEDSYPAKVLQSWDTADKDGPQNSLSVCTTWILLNDHYYLIDLCRGRFEYPQLREMAITLAQMHRPDWVLIEEASTGIALAQELKNIKFGGGVRPVPVERDKISRAYVQQAKFYAGQ